MACKEDVLVRLEKGLTVAQIAAELECLPEYVRATRARAFGNGKVTGRAYEIRNSKTISARKRKQERFRYRTDPDYRERRLAACAAYRERKKLEPARGKSSRL